MTNPTAQPDPKVVEQVQAEEQALLNRTLEQAQVAHLQQRVVELAVRVHDLEQQLADRANDNDGEG